MDLHQIDSTSSGPRDRTAQCLPPLLGSMMFYLAGRIDAADRRASIYLTVSAAFLAIMVEDMLPFRPESVWDLANDIVRHPSVVFAAASAFIALVAILPRRFASDTWVSQTFMRKADPAEIFARIDDDPSLMLKEMIEMQQTISGLARRKNTMASHALNFLLVAAGLFVLGY